VWKKQETKSVLATQKNLKTQANGIMNMAISTRNAQISELWHVTLLFDYVTWAGERIAQH